MHPERANRKNRKPYALFRGKAYPVTKFIQEKSQFKDKSGHEPMKLIALFDDIGMKWYVYFPKEYDDKPESYVNELNSQAHVIMVFYGQVGVGNELHVLQPGEEIDQEKLEGIRLIEESERSVLTSPSKRPYNAPSEESPNKKSRDD